MHHLPELEIWKQTCLEFIERAASKAALESVAAEIKTSSEIIKAGEDDLKQIRIAYIQRAAQLKETQ